MKQVIVDTNALLRFLLNDIPQQKKEVEKLLWQAKQNKRTIRILPIVIFEIDFTLRKYYQFGKEKLIDKLESIVGTDYMQVEQKEVFLEALKLYRVTNISFVDCFLLLQAESRGAELFTFDKKLIKLSKQQGSTLNGAGKSVLK